MVVVPPTEMWPRIDRRNPHRSLGTDESVLRSFVKNHRPCWHISPNIRSPTSHCHRSRLRNFSLASVKVLYRTKINISFTSASVFSHCGTISRSRLSIVYVRFSLFSLWYDFPKQVVYALRLVLFIRFVASNTSRTLRFFCCVR